MFAQPGNTSSPDLLSNGFNPQLYNLFMQNPGPMAIFKGREGICEAFNPTFGRIWNYRIAHHQPVTEAWPEFDRSRWAEITERVFDKAETVYFYSYEAPGDWTHSGIQEIAYFDFVFSPYRDINDQIAGIIVTGFNVTDRVVTLERLADQELLLKSVTEAAATALWVIDEKGDITFVSEAWLNWTGKPLDDHLGRKWLNSVIEEEREVVFHHFAKRFSNRHLYNIDFRITGADGELLWIAATGKPRYLPDGSFAGYVGSCMDITARKESEMLLRESEERFRNIADTAPVFIWISGPDMQNVFFNQSWLEFTGDTLHQALGQTQMEKVHPDEKQKVIQTFMEAFEHRQEFYIEHRLRRHDDVYRWIGMRCVPRFTPDGVFEGYIGSGMDINESKEHEQLKNEFIGMASHELKTPLTSIKAYIQLLQSMYKGDDDDEFLRKSLSTVNKQVNKLVRLITELLDVSKIESGRMNLSSEVFVINDLLKEIIDEVQHTSVTHDIVLNETEPLAVNADRDRIAQVITNLLTNAIKYSPGSDRVDVYVKHMDGKVQVSVRDYGIGINSEEQRKIFARFYRVEGRNEQTFSGFGIGLYVAAEIIRRHHSRLWVESEKGHGSSFGFTLPVSR